jgi:spermidine synthase
MRWYFSFFVLSGFCSLVDEVVWLRLAMAHFGVNTALVSIVLSMFMAGLGLGSWGAGVLVRKCRAAAELRALRLYSAAELLVGISAVMVPYELKLGRTLLAAIGSYAAWDSSQYYVLTGAWIAITLVPWSACMGSTFPLLMLVIRQTSRTESQHSFSYLYVANVLGALLGTIFSAFVLIELFGFQRTLWVAGTLNALVAVSAYCLSFSIDCRLLHTTPSPPRAAMKLYGLPRRTALWMLFATGLCSMGMEVIWIRQFTPYLGNVVYAFAGILAVYLLATFWGSHDYHSWVHSHDVEDSAPSWSLLALWALIPIAAADPLLPIRMGSVELGGVRLSAIVLFCAFTGFLTPLLVDFWSSGDPERVGSAYAVNVLGCILGPIIAGFLLLPLFGERWASAALSLPLFAFGALAGIRNASPWVTRRQWRIHPKLRYGLLVLAGMLILLESHNYESRYPEGKVRRDYAATVMATGKGRYRGLLVNGITMTGLDPITKYIAHLPLSFKEKPARNGLVICFGMGTTFRSMLSWGIPTTGVDLIPSVPPLFGYFHSDADQLIRSPLAKIVIDDGRRFLDGSPDSFDVVVVDPPPPTQAAGSSLLYSQEFYAVVKKHLRSGGILNIWYPERDGGDSATNSSVAQALKQSFTHVRAFEAYDDHGIYFLASSDPLPNASASTLAARLPAAAAKDFLEWAPGLTLEEQFEKVLSRERSLEQLISEDPRAPALEDDQPINEYYLLRSWFHYYR